MRDTSYPWPYFEGLSLAEATNELSLFVTGIYGHELTKQHGAPIRLVVPWKYGYKSIKSIVRIEFTDRQPGTFWSALIPWEYDFTANVDPTVPHPRWSQAYERGDWHRGTPTNPCRTTDMPSLWPVCIGPETAARPLGWLGVGAADAVRRLRRPARPHA